jgi:hypothetical protein
MDMNKVIDKICEYEKKGISDIKMIALVSDTSSEVMFYGVIDGVNYQSNNMLEEGKVESDVVDSFYEEIAAIVRSDKKYDSAKINIVKADSKKCTVDYDSKKCKTYKIIKEWERV